MGKVNAKQAKEYIMTYWKVSSGKKITEMLNRYWELTKKETEEKLIKTAKKVFKV